MSVLLIDTHNLVHRASHAYRELWSPDAQVFTGMYYGFFTLLQKYVSEFRPEMVWLISDPNEAGERKNWRHDVLDNYKRRDTKRTPDQERQVNAIRKQMPALKAAALLTNVFWMEQPGLEADEIIGWLWNYYQSTPFVLVSTDKDMLTLLRPNFGLYYPGQRRTLFVTSDNFAEMNMEFIPGNMKKPAQERLSFPTVKEWAEFRWLTGDDSDMIPGLPKCGPVGARKILDAGGYYPFCEAVAAKPKPGKNDLAWTTEEAKQIYERNKLLMRINPPPAEYVLFEMDNPRCAVGQANFEALATWMRSLSFSDKENSLIDRLQNNPLCLPKGSPWEPLRQF